MGLNMATDTNFKSSFGGTRDFLPGVCRDTWVTLETHIYRVSSFSFLSYLLRSLNWSKTRLPLCSISSGLHVYRICAEEVMRIWDIFKMSNYDHFFGAFSQSWGLHRGDLKPCIMVGVTDLSTRADSGDDDHTQKLWSQPKQCSLISQDIPRESILGIRLRIESWVRNKNKKQSVVSLSGPLDTNWERLSGYWYFLSVGQKPVEKKRMWSG